jgi:hypothetical protein
MTKNTMQQTLAQQLCDSVDSLHKQAEKVEFWASALTGFSQPVPDYDPETTSVAQYVKPGRPRKRRHRRRSANETHAIETTSGTKPGATEGEG